MRIRIRAFIALAALALMPLAMPLRACCDDFWSCLGAVATGGLSCVVEDLIHSIQSMIQNVSNLVSTIGRQAQDVINLAKGELTNAGNDLRNLLNQAEGDLNNAKQKAQTAVDAVNRPNWVVAGAAQAPAGIVMPSGAAAPAAGASTAKAGTKLAPPPPGGATHLTPVTGSNAILIGLLQPADLADVKGAMQRGKEAIDRLAQESTPHIAPGRDLVQQAEQQALAAAGSAGNIAESILLSPLRTLTDTLNDLVNHPDHIFDPSRIVDDMVNSISNQVIDTMNQVHDAVMNQARATLDLVHPHAQAALDHAEVAKKVADAMEKLSRNKTKGNLDALNGLLPRAPLPTVQFMAHVVGFSHPTGLITIDPNANKTKVQAPFNRMAAVKLTAKASGTQMAGRLRKPWADFKRLQATPAKPVPEAKPRVDAEIARRFAGKTPQQAEAEKRALLAEARTRFAKDPKTLQKVVDLIEDHPTIRGIVSPRDEVRDGARVRQ